MVVIGDKVMKLEKLPSNVIWFSINYKVVIKFSAPSHNTMV